MNIYLLKAIREIKRKKTRSIPIIIIIMVSGIATIMYANIYFSFNNFLVNMWEGNHYHNLLLTTNPSSPDNLSKLVTETVKDTGITPKYEIRSFYEGKLFSNKNLDANILSIRIIAVNVSHDLEVDQLIYYEGISLNNSNISHPMVVDKANANKNGWEIGDTFKVYFENQTTYFTIVGLVESPEYIDQPKIDSVFLGNWINPVIWISLNDVNKPITLKTNQIAIYFDHPDEKNIFLTRLLANDQSKIIIFIEGRNTYFETEKLIFFSIWILSSIIFIATSIILVYIVISYLVEEERQSLGVLLALGFNSKEIVFSFFFFSLILSLIGGFLGCLFGILIGIQIVSNIFTADLRAIPSVGALSTYTIFFSIFYLLLIIITITCTSIVSCRKILNITPLESIRPNLNLQPGNKVLIEKLLDKLHFFLPPLTRFSLRSVFRKRRKAIFGIIGIALATTVTLFGSFMYIGYGDNLNYYFSENEKWDVQIIFNDNVKINSSNAFTIFENFNIHSDIQQIEPFIITIIRFESDMSRTYTLIGIQDNSSMRKFNGIGSPDPGSLYVTIDIAKRLDISKNDPVTIIDATGQSNQLKISYILTEISGNGLYTSIDTARSLTHNNDSSFINGVYLKTSDPEKVKNFLTGNILFKEIILKEDLISMAKNTQNQQITSFELSFLIGLITGLAISVIIISISISERMRDFINFRAIGISNWEIFRNVILEIFIISIGGTFFGLLGGIWILNSLFDFMASIGVSYVANYSIPTLIVPIMNILLGITLSTFLSLHSLFKASIAESTVSRAIG